MTDKLARLGREGGVMEDWGALKARLRADADVLDQQALVADTHEEMLSVRRFAADIRAALERVEELERENADFAKTWWESHAAATMRKRAEAAEAKLAKVVEALSGLAEAVRRLQGIEIPYPVAIPIGVKLRLAISALAAAKEVE